MYYIAKVAGILLCNIFSANHVGNMWGPYVPLYSILLKWATESENEWERGVCWTYGKNGLANRQRNGAGGSDPTHLQIPESVISQLQLARDTLHCFQCPLAPHFRQVLEYHKVPPAIGNVAEHYMGSQPKLYASKESAAMILGVDASKLEPQLCLLSNSFVHLDRHRRLQLEQVLAEGEGQLLTYLDIARYDETPVTVAHHQPWNTSLGPTKWRLLSKLHPRRRLPAPTSVPLRCL